MRNNLESEYCSWKKNDGGNLVYSAPTSAGKTMVAELLMLKRFVETKRKAIFILPFVSVVREKVHYLQELFQDFGVRVEGFMGGQNPAGGFKMVDIAVCTIEKANSLVNRIMEENEISQLGCLVVDELHMVGDAHRGYLLELLLTKVRYLSLKAAGDESHVQLIGMSATLPNLPLLAKWLNADLYHTTFRPVPLTEMIKIGSSVYDNSLALLRPFTPAVGIQGDEDNVISLCLETIQEGHSVLVFCPTKNWCEKLADTIAREFFNLCKNAQEANGVIPIQLDSQKLLDVIEQLRRSPVGLDKALGRMVPMGVAYHHAGLTFDERDVIEGGFRRGALRVLVATSTLSSGVNLPARRVIIRTPIFHGDVIDTLTYKQMAGRAGRKGVDTAGESILVCKTSEKNRAVKLVSAELPPVRSCLASQGSLSGSMKRAILEVVVSGVAPTPESLQSYAQCTLLAASMEEADQESRCDSVQECVEFLLEWEFIALQGSADAGLKYHATPLGSAVLASALAPDEGLTVFAELQKARRCFVLENDLHLVYIVTPIYMCNSLGVIDWYQYLAMWESLSPGFRSVADLVGVKESFLSRAVQGRVLTKTSEQMRALQVHKRFYTAMALQDLVNEVPLTEVAAKYKCPKGTLQSLQQAAATFAGMITVFCRRLGWHHMAILLEDFQSRLTYGVQRELVDIVRLSLLTGFRARMLFDSGLQTIAQVASAELRDVERVLAKAVPFQSKKKVDGDTDWEANERQRKALCGILGPGGQALTDADAAQLIIEEAQKLMAADLAQLGVQWNGPAENVKTPQVSLRRKSKGSSGKKRRSTGKKKTPVYTKSPECCIKAPAVVADSEVLFSEPLIDNSVHDSEPQKSVLSDLSLSPATDKSDGVDSPSEVQSAQITGSSSVLEADASALLAQLTPGLWQPKSVNASPVMFHDEMDSTCDFMRGFSTQQALIELSASPVLRRSEDCEKADDSVTDEREVSAMSEDALFPEDNEGDNLDLDDAIREDSFTMSVMDAVFNCDISLGMKEISPKPSKETAALIDAMLDDPKQTPKSVPRRAAKKRRSTEQESSVSPPKQNCGENTSDCVPPTPPNVNDTVNTPQKLIGGANGTPTRVLRSAKKQKSPEHLVATQESFTIIDVASHKELFKQFVKEWRTQSQFSLSLACDRLPNYTTDAIGANFNQKDCPTPLKEDLLICRGVLIHGVAVSWEHRDAYYISLSSALSDTDLDPDESMAAPPLDPCIPLKQRLSAVKLCLQSTSAIMSCFDVKSTLSFLSEGCGVGAKGSFRDPKVADWMLDPGSRSKNLHRMVKMYAPDEIHLLEGLGGGIGQSSIGLTPENPGSGRFRSCTESILVRKVMSPLSLLLEEAGLKKAYEDIEMPTVALLSKMELNGMGFSLKESESQRELLQARLSFLEQQAYQLSKHPFQLTAPAEVAQVLFVELKLPPSGDPANPSVSKTLGVRKSSRGKKPSFSTSKEILERLRHLHPLPGVILEWRRLTSALSKVVFPLQRVAVHSNRLSMQRIHGECDTHTATGRVSMHEPSLQMIPNDFDIEGFEGGSSRNSRLGTSSAMSLSMRHAFIPFKGGVLFAADYSQLELRMIAHLSQDKKLIRVLNGGGDVFKIIAAQWKGVEVDEVTAAQRQQTKQICYGMIYGIGTKALAEQLSISEEEAGVFCESFKSKFIGMRTYLRETIQKCREKGFVETISGRRRYLPAIHDANSFSRAHAERQAVNTTVQGSAADLVKAAMLKADRKLAALFPQSRFPHLHAQDPIQGARKARKTASAPLPQGAYLILQLHDELIYEVNSDHLTPVAMVVKDAMETALTLDVKFPVKVKVGHSWGSLKDYNVN